MNKTSYLSLLLIASLCNPVMAVMQSPSTEATSTSESTLNLATKQLKVKLQQLKTFNASFTQKVTDGQGELVQESVGELTLKQPNLMIWQVNEPDENLLVADGETLWYSDPFVEQVTAVQQSQSVASNPVVLLTDPNNQSWSDFTVTYHQDHFMVTAKQPESQIAQLALYFDQQNQLTQLSFTDRQQQVSQLTFSDIRQNRPIGNEIFVFSVPDGFELDDQR
ncbi:outer membrane lipoprotein chaperone LolA [Aliiglaciecola litoralis]|uniref:Outer-membrane lipoprotein carrier protein n=1 Tax=Aliiglaciecola litoralis TaxID=582857 RepID=A0ABN1LC45_9ALTE